MGLRSEFNTLSLCAGAGGLDLGVRLAVRNARAVCYVEREAFLIESLVQKMHAGILDDAPVWSDLRRFDGAAWRGVVDCVIAGIPCQGNSLAGKRRLADDPRNLWPATLRILREVEPTLFFLENVPGILIPDKRGNRESPIARILGELAEAGFDAEWDVFSAEEIGATHKRERFFLLAYSERFGSYSGSERTGREARSDAGGSGERSTVGNSKRRSGRRRKRDERGGVRSQRKDGEGETANRSGKSEPILADTGRKGEQRRRITGDLACATGGSESEGVQRERCRDDADDCRAVVVNTDGRGCGTGRRRDIEDGFADSASEALVNPNHSGCGERDRHDDEGEPDPQRTSEALGVALGDSQSFGLERERAGGKSVTRSHAESELPLRSSGVVAVTESEQRRIHTRQGSEGQRAIDIGRIGLFPPGPGEFERWAEVLEINPSLEPAVCRLADGMANRVQRLRAVLEFTQQS